MKVTEYEMSLAIFHPIPAFGQTQSSLVKQIYCTFPMSKPIIVNNVTTYKKWLILIQSCVAERMVYRTWHTSQSCVNILVATHGNCESHEKWISDTICSFIGWDDPDAVLVVKWPDSNCCNDVVQPASLLCFSNSIITSNVNFSRDKNIS